MTGGFRQMLLPQSAQLHRFLFPLIERDVWISQIALSDQLRCRPTARQGLRKSVAGKTKRGGRVRELLSNAGANNFGFIVAARNMQQQHKNEE